MDHNSSIKEALERTAKALELRPGFGQGTATSKATLRDGLECEVVEGAYRLTVGMTDKYGGTNAGPNPGVLGRAALGSCIAVGIGMWAARMEVPLESAEVEVEADYDARGELGVGAQVRAGYAAMRYRIRVRSGAPEAKVRAMLDKVIAHSSYIDDFANPVPVAGEIVVERS